MDVESRRPLSALIWGNAISLAGNVVASVALPWFVLVTTGSAAQAGIVAFAATAPFVVGSLVAGRVIDALGLRAASVLSDVASGVAVATIPLLFALGWLSVPVLAGPAALARCSMPPARPPGERSSPHSRPAVPTGSSERTPGTRAPSIWPTSSALPRRHAHHPGRRAGSTLARRVLVRKLLGLTIGTVLLGGWVLVDPGTRQFDGVRVGPRGARSASGAPE